MALIKLNCYKRDAYRSFDYDYGTEEKWINTNNIHRMERDRVYGSKGNHPREPIVATRILLNEYVSRSEPKKVLMVVETPEHIYEKSKS